MRGATVVRVVAATLATIAFVSGFLNLANPDDGRQSPEAVRPLVLAHNHAGDVPPLRFLVTATGLNPVERRLQATLTLVQDVPHDQPRFVDTNGTPIKSAGHLRPQFADAKLEVTLVNGYSKVARTSFPLADVVEPSGTTDPRQVTVSIPAVADPSQFPNDTYWFSLAVGARLTSGVVAVAPTGTQGPTVNVEAKDDLPVVVGVALDDRLGHWNLDIDQLVAGGTARPSIVDSADFRMEFSRSWTHWAFIYSVSMMPAVIGLSFFVRTRRRRGAKADDTSAAMELAAALLALIALRQVFVPTDITGLTRLDFVLGVQLLAVCWLMAVTYVTDTPGHTPDRGPDREDSG